MLEGAIVATIILTAFALAIPRDRDFLKNLFFFASLVSLLLVFDQSMTAEKAGAWYVSQIIENCTAWNSSTCATWEKTYSYTQQPATWNTATWDIFYIVIILTIVLAMIYVVIMLIDNTFKAIIAAWNRIRGVENE